MAAQTPTAERREGGEMDEKCFLENFFMNHVLLQGEKDENILRNYNVVKSTVTKLIPWVNEYSTYLYPEDPVLTGSYKQDLYIHSETSSSISTFDFLIPLRYPYKLKLLGSLNICDESFYENQIPIHICQHGGLPMFRWGSKLMVDLDRLEADAEVFCGEPWPCKKLANAERREKFKKSLDSCHLDPVCVLQDFHTYVHKTLTADENSHPRENDPVFQARLWKPRLPWISKSIKERITLLPRNDKCPAVQLIFRLGAEELVLVQLIPALQGKVDLSENWQTSDLARLSDWWYEEPGDGQQRFRQKGEKVMKSGADLVSIGGYWRVSFASAETNFLKVIDHDGEQQRKALKLLMFINMEHWVPEYGKILTSYHLKTILLWALEIQPEKEKWETLAWSLMTLLHILHYCLKSEKLPHYFLRNFNLFNKRYKVGKGIYEHLALQVLTKEVELMVVDPVGYISLRFFNKVSKRVEAFSRVEGSLLEFKESHQEGLKALKKLEKERLYEFEEELLSDKNVCNSDGRQQDVVHCNLDTILAEMKQWQEKSHQCQGKTKEPVRVPSKPVIFSSDLNQFLQSLFLSRQADSMEAVDAAVAEFPEEEEVDCYDFELLPMLVEDELPPCSSLPGRKEEGAERADRQHSLKVQEFPDDQGELGPDGRDPGHTSMAGTSQHEARGPRKMEEEEEEAGCHGAAQGFLGWFLKHHVYPEQREHRRREEEFKVVEELVKRIMAFVRNWNVRLFTGEAILVGSQAQDLHVQAESDSSTYDFLAPIHYRTGLILLGTLYSQPRTDMHFLPSWLSLKVGVPVYRWENKLVVDYNKVTLRDILDGQIPEVTEKDILTEEDIKEINGRQRDLWHSGLDPFLVARKFHEFVKYAVAEETRKTATRIRNIRLNDFAQRPAVQLSLEVDGRAVSINLAPAILDKMDMSMDWPRQDLRWLSDWWDQEEGTERIKPAWNIMDIYKTKADLVAKNPYWRLTFSRAETRLLRDLDLDGGCRRDALQLLKQINMEKWVPRYGRVLTSYHLKMVLFWASDLNLETKSW
uniref:Putative nucleotidyltransferase MAB21L1 n=1 Tax=Pelusios castaneus TaxID=367368 RepID=A0A8C8VJR1_9SAUR